MAQLSDDCFAFGGALLGVDAALALIAARIAPVVSEEVVTLSAAAGRILARDIVAGIDVPPHANSAVDGFALAHADLLPDRETVLPVTGRTAAGHPLGRRPPGDREDRLAMGRRSAWASAKPSTALLACGGTSIPATISRARMRPAAADSVTTSSLSPPSGYPRRDQSEGHVDAKRSRRQSDRRSAAPSRQPKMV